MATQINMPKLGLSMKEGIVGKWLKKEGDSLKQGEPVVEIMTDKINNGEGSLGMLLNDKALYVNLNSTAASADKLLIDLKQSPKRYVHFSLFGSKN